jgi:hypothetical protein
MAKQLIKQVSGAPSAEVIGMIDTSDKVQALRAAGYRYETRLSELEGSSRPRLRNCRAYISARSRRLTANHNERDGQV